MKTIYSPAHHNHHGVELKDGAIKPCFEMPQRADTILARVQTQQLGEILAPKTYAADAYIGAHTARYIHFLQNAWREWSALGHSHPALPLIWPVRDLRSDIEPEHIDGKLGFYSMDAGVAIMAGTWEAISTGANIALTGADMLMAGERSAFALSRPPGHHAAAEYMGGYCYLNNAAIAAQRCIAQGARKVAVLDVDYHHGNGTQSIFYDRDDVLFVSLHGDPKVSYPYFLGHRNEKGIGKGEGYNHNYPLAHGTTWAQYGPALADACQKIGDFSPDALIVSLGVDTYSGDPISHFMIETDDFVKIGAAIGSMNRPTLFIMEGGYMVDDIGVNAVNVLSGFAAA